MGVGPHMGKGERERDWKPPSGRRGKGQACGKNRGVVSFLNNVDAGEKPEH